MGVIITVVIPLSCSLGACSVQRGFAYCNSWGPHCGSPQVRSTINPQHCRSKMCSTWEKSASPVPLDPAYEFLPLKSEKPGVFPTCQPNGVWGLSLKWLGVAETRLILRGRWLGTSIECPHLQLMCRWPWKLRWRTLSNPFPLGHDTYQPTQLCF